jgi:hypothetical protein
MPVSVLDCAHRDVVMLVALVARYEWYITPDARRYLRSSVVLQRAFSVSIFSSNKSVEKVMGAASLIFLLREESMKYSEWFGAIRLPRLAALILVTATVAISACGGSGGGGGDSGGGPPPGPDTVRRLHQLYVFRSPANTSNTVIILTLNPRAGVDHPTTFSTDQAVRVNIDTNFDGTTDLVLEARFGPADASGVQPVTLHAGVGVIAQGSTGSNLAVTGGGQFRAALADDPFFVDRDGMEQYIAGGAFPRPVGTASNFYGPDGNCLALILEIPSISLAPAGTTIDVWATTTVNGVQNDRRGRPLTVELLLLPRPPGTGPYDPSAFVTNTQPSQDPSLFGTRARSVLTGFYRRDSGGADAVANFLLPDAMKFEVGNLNGYGTVVTQGSALVLGNGRRLRDDTADSLLNFLTASGITTDNVPDDNGARITDGNAGTVAAFPYIGPPN